MNMEELINDPNGIEIMREITKTTARVKETHKEKMDRKRREREFRYRSTGQGLILANISVNHMDYGMSPAEHLRAKQERLKEKV